MEGQPKGVDDSLLKMALRLSSFSLSNIEWGCLYSGAGIIHILNDKEINKLFGKFKYDEKKHLLNNLVIIKCLYKKAKPSFTKPPEEILNPGKYMWDFTSFNKEILPSSQALGMLSLCKAAEFYRTENPTLGAIMLKNAQIYYDFTTTYLRNDEGLFISAEDKTKFINDNLVIKQSKSSSKLTDQALMHEALLTLHSITSKGNIEAYRSHKSETYLKEANNIFKYLFSNYNHLLEESSRDISQVISSLARCCRIQRDTESRVNYNHLIALLCAELESRIKITGEVEKNHDNLDPASLVTHFRSASALVEGYKETGIEKFKDISLRIFRFLEELYDYSMNLFVVGDYKKIGYSSRDIAEVLKALLMYYSLEKNDRILQMIIGFHEASIERSGLVQSVPANKLSLEGFENIKDIIVDQTEESTKAPVFLKSFRINNKKSSICTVSGYFSSNYSLYLSYMALYYFTPLINSGETDNDSFPEEEPKEELKEVSNELKDPITEESPENSSINN